MELTGIAGQNQTLAELLSQDQKESLQEILSRYDPENLTRDKMESLRRELAEAGIHRNYAVMSILNEAGFNLRGKSGETAVVTGERSLQPFKSELWDLFQQFQMGKISEAEFKSQVGELKAGLLLKITL